jgi:hypothetical protein
MHKEINSVNAGNLPDPDGRVPDAVSVAEVHSRLQGEWVLMRVTRFDDTRDPTHGVVVAHSLNPEDITNALPPRPDPLAPSDGPYYVFLAEPRTRSGPELDRAALDMLEQFNARRETRRRGMA